MTPEQEHILRDLYYEKEDGHDDIFCDSVYFDHDLRFGDQFAMFLDDCRKGYAIPDDETPDTFSDRLDRSIKAGRNLLYEELEPLPPYASREEASTDSFGSMTPEEEFTAAKLYGQKCNKYPSIFGSSGLGFDYCQGQILRAEKIYYAAPTNETLATFTDRLERSIKAGRNLFLEEWKPLPPLHLVKGVVY